VTRLKRENGELDAVIEDKNKGYKKKRRAKYIS
jgi:hypothetical protein